jgi:hypothetical protein
MKKTEVLEKMESLDPSTKAQVQELLKLMEEEMKKSLNNKNVGKIDKYYKKLDKLLGTELSEEDQEKAEVWERSRR